MNHEYFISRENMARIGATSLSLPLTSQNVSQHIKLLLDELEGWRSGTHRRCHGCRKPTINGHYWCGGETCTDKPAINTTEVCDGAPKCEHGIEGAVADPSLCSACFVEHARPEKWEPKVRDWVRHRQFGTVARIDGQPVGREYPVTMLNGRKRHFHVGLVEPWHPRVDERVKYGERTAVVLQWIAEDAIHAQHYKENGIVGTYIPVKWDDMNGSGRGGITLEKISPLPPEEKPAVRFGKSRPVCEGKPAMTSTEELAEAAAKASHIGVRPQTPKLVEALESQHAEQSEAKLPCSDCKGSGRYVGLDKDIPCPTCKGAG